MDKLSAILVTFNPDESNVSELVSVLSKSLSNVVVVDNSENQVSFLKRLSEEYKNVEVISLKNNMGIAEAQNIGVRRVAELQSKGVFFFDQDSRIDSSFIANLYSSFLDLNEKENGKVAAVGPVFYDSRYKFCYPVIKLNEFGIRSKISPDLLPNKDDIEVSFIISSGSFSPIDMFYSKVGMFRADFFIDYVDTEWCLRAGFKGYKIFATKRALMEHAIGDSNISVFNKWKIPVHSAWRRYFRLRNYFYLLRLEHVPIGLKVREFFTNNLHQLLIVLNVKNKMEYIKYWYNSFVDGLKVLFK